MHNRVQQSGREESAVQVDKRRGCVLSVIVSMTWTFWEIVFPDSWLLLVTGPTGKLVFGKTALLVTGSTRKVVFGVTALRGTGVDVEKLQDLGVGGIAERTTTAAEAFDSWKYEVFILSHLLSQTPKQNDLQPPH